jgi:hypothetical protein
VAALAPSAAGLALIPLLVPRIDEAVTNWMDARLRPHLPPVSLCGAAAAAGGRGSADRNGRSASQSIGFIVPTAMPTLWSSLVQEALTPSTHHKAT